MLDSVLLHVQVLFGVVDGTPNDRVSLLVQC